MKKNIKIGLSILLILILTIIPATRVNAETRNNNPLLREILIDGKAVEPEFDQFITDYVIGVEKENIEIKAEPDDPNASVEIIGNTKLKEGKNEIEIKVTAEDRKTTQSYYLHITRGDVNKANANLKELEIEGITLNPTFNSKDTKYYVEYEGIIDNLNIKAIPENENAKVEIEVNDNYDTGSVHLVKINVTAEDSITVKTYQIIARKAGENPDEQNELETIEAEMQQKEELKKQEEQKHNNTIVIIIIILLIICVSIFIIIKKKKDK